jgi:hypothetical protein
LRNWQPGNLATWQPGNLATWFFVLSQAKWRAPAPRIRRAQEGTIGSRATLRIVWLRGSFATAASAHLFDVPQT